MVRISVELPEETAEALSRAAAELRSTREDLAAEAVQAMLADRRAQARSVARGRADFEAGRSFDHDEVMQELDDWAGQVEARHRRGA